MASDITAWHADDVPHGIQSIFISNNITAEEAGVPGGLSRWVEQADRGRGDEKKEAVAALDNIIYMVLALMREESDLAFTTERDPSKWPIDELEHTVKKHKKVRKQATVEGREGHVYRDVVSHERGWGNTHVACSNPTNAEGEKGVIDPKPGWAYRMVAAPQNRDVLLGVLEMWDPFAIKDVEHRERLTNPATNPKREVALDIVTNILGGKKSKKTAAAN